MKSIKPIEAAIRLQVEGAAKAFKESDEYADMMQDGLLHHLADWVMENRADLYGKIELIYKAL